MLLRTASSRLLLSLALLRSSCEAHRNLPPGISCGGQFASPDAALAFPNSTISWSSFGVYDCDHPVRWFDATSHAAGQELKFNVLVPEIARFGAVRMVVAALGPGLPALPAADADDGGAVPEAVRAYAGENGLGGVLFDAPDDQSNCDHVVSSELSGSPYLTLKDGRCHFFEAFTRSNFWPILDGVLPAPEEGTYKFAVYERGGSTAKAAFNCCEWVDEFMTPYEMPTTECEMCGANPDDNPDWSSLFFESGAMEAFGGYPPLVTCSEDGATVVVELPAGEDCPPAPSGGEGEDDGHGHDHGDGHAHDHAHDDASEGSEGASAQAVAACDDGSVRVFAADGDAVTYGATGDDQCVHMCVPEMAMNFMPNVARGSCPAQGFGTPLSMGVDIDLQGWPATVDVYGKGGVGGAEEDGGTDADPSDEDGAAGEGDAAASPTSEDGAPEDEAPGDSAAARAATGIATAVAAVLALAA